jgi:hypothetical protein
MKIFIVSLAAVSAVAAPPSSDQKPAGNSARIKACTILTRDVIDKVKTAASKPVPDTPPGETPVGPNGSYCDYGSMGLQIDPFPGADRIRNSPSKSWTSVSGVGETAYFNKAGNVLAELLVWNSSHHFAVQIEAAPGHTADELKSSTIELAKLIIPKLK